MSDIKIVVGADVSQATTGLRSVQGELGKTAIIANTTATSFKNFGSQISSSLSSAAASLGSAGIFAAIAAGATIAVKWLQVLAKDFITVSHAAEITAQKIKEYNTIVDASVKSVAKEQTEIIGLVGILKSETETRERKLSAIKELQNIQPEIFGQLKLEGETVLGLNAAYDAYLINLKNIVQAKIYQAELDAKIARQLKLQQAIIPDQADGYKKLSESEFLAAQNAKKLADNQYLIGLGITKLQGKGELKQLASDIDFLGQQLYKLSNTIKVPVIKVPKVKIKPDKIELIDTEHFDKVSVTDKITSVPLVAKTKVIIKPEIVFLKQDEDKFFAELNAFFAKERLEKFQADATAAIDETMRNIVNGSISSAADSIGEALAGGGKDVVPRLFDGIIKGIGGQIKELGKFLVKIGLEMLVAKKAISLLKLTPQTAIIAGVALQVLGALLVSAANKKASGVGQGFASGVRSFGGGFATVGERGPERVFLPQGSSVQPNNEVQAYGGGQMVFIPEVVLRGPDLVIAFNRASQQLSRNN